MIGTEVRRDPSHLLEIDPAEVDPAEVDRHEHDQQDRRKHDRELGQALATRLGRAVTAIAIEHAAHGVPEYWAVAGTSCSPGHLAPNLTPVLDCNGSWLCIGTIS